MDVEDDNKKWPGKFVMMLEALAHRIRRNIFSLLIEHPSLSFNQLMTKLKIERASLAYHLGILRKANLINNFYDKREGVKDHSFYELSAFGNKIYQELFEKVELESKLEQYNTINFRNAISYTIEHERQLKAAKAKQKEGEVPSEIIIVKGDKTSKVTEWQTQVLNPAENKKLYSLNFLTQNE
ncbi:MAG: helix-turn-helix transcriptional regulator [Thermoplasmata archaeon]|nr:helix-turn-helix transcriptional regulator [Thermoplasmata archaeon]